MPCGLAPSGVSLKRAFAGQKSVPRFRYLRRGTGKARSEIVENGYAECRKYTLRSHISCFCSENYQFSLEAKNALARKSGSRGSGCGALGDRALPELPADIKDQLPLRNEPRGLFQKRHDYYTKIQTACVE